VNAALCGPSRPQLGRVAAHSGPDIRPDKDQRAAFQQLVAVERALVVFLQTKLAEDEQRLS
jgi:hypothetical protein